MRRRRIHGYTDMGQIVIPPQPTYIIMTDREDGTLWHLTHNTTVFSTDGNGYISITDSIPTTPDKFVYGPYDGPYVQERNNLQEHTIVRLLIRNGFLGYEMFEQVPVQSIDTKSVITRRTANIHRQILRPTFWIKRGDTLSWTTETI